MALLNGIRVTLVNASNTQLSAGPNILGFNGLNAAAGAEDGNTYQWVLEANFNAQGIATAREGGFGVLNLGAGVITRNTVWSTIPGNVQLTITGTTHLIITPMAEQLAANTFVLTLTAWTVTTESAILINRPPTTSTTITLPSVTVRQGGELTLKDIAGNALSSPSTANAAAGELIDGASSLTINRNYGSAVIVPVPIGALGANSWYIKSLL